MEVEKDECFYWYFTQAKQSIRTQAGLFWGAHPRGWYVQVTNRHELHPVVNYIVKQGVRPKDWQQLLLEWPAVSTEDESQIAYTRDEEKGRAYVRTRTSVGKYLSRHWPHVPDHIRRDWAGRFVPAIYKLEHTKEAIIAGIECGPRSCMQSGYGSIPFKEAHKELLLAYLNTGEGRDDVPWDRHPYAVYDPKYGWGMATRNDPGNPNIVLGRALVLDTEIAGKPKKGFVRSYSRSPHGDDSNSGSDEKLQAWLKDRGFEEWNEWPDGTKLAKLAHPERSSYFMVPYIDGDVQNVADEGRHLAIEDGGAFDCTNTNGTYAEADNDDYIGDCDRCGNDVMESDEYRIWAGVDEDTCICGCCSAHYTYVSGSNRRGDTREYYVHADSVLYVSGSAYDKDNLPDHIVLCADGELRHIDSTVWIDDEYHDIDSDEIVCCADDEWRLRDECWKCPLTEEWYSDNEDGIEVNGEQYSEDGLIKAIKQFQGE